MACFAGSYDVIVLGAGHAGCEAALACARMGLKTLCLTLHLDAVALMPCNPAIGGTSKGHLVRELDALGGEMGLAADDTFIQMRMLNTGKGPAVHSLRAQMDKRRYHERMKRAVESEPLLDLKMGECEQILTQGGRVSGIRAAGGAQYSCRGIVMATGVYLQSRILIGSHVTESGPAGLTRATALSASLSELGFSLRRFKTGTPARVHRRSLDFSKMEPQYGDVPPPHFSFLTPPGGEANQDCCYLTYTNAATHKVIQDNIHRSAMYSGLVTGTGTRYCPSIEDKITRFADKERHQLFIEPEGRTTAEMYVQGMSTSLPYDVQVLMLRTIPGLESCEIMRAGYAIEYDCIDPCALSLSLGAKALPGLYFAGQINGSSGYEEAAAQGLFAGINCALWCKGEEPLLLARSDAYIGVLVDDLATKGTNEPYRMMTSRAEYRLLLRQDNADLRLTELGRRTGLIGPARYDALRRKQEGIERALRALDIAVSPGEAVQALLAQKGEAPLKTGCKLIDLLRRPALTYTDLLGVAQGLPPLAEDVREQVEIEARYAGYIQKQKQQVERFAQMETLVLPQGIDYSALHGLRLEARQKLSARQPVSIGQASRISGVSPADIAVLLVYLKKREGERP
ncbi:MAG: tRNA uridine-5-carboxymethylaminomethyl(34) synthesis enzyme MnmG [Christensenellaceae bacterium]|jgi:tRNA uridine 5-carboxymethylaminomethyl modification enzyme|nr:tRNA uridine-5-carboxymethylaminomethyl(34) synthesis enzyme MnmG [Christensenellaceae bacterium]